MKTNIWILLLILTFIGCKKPCDNSLRIGEIVQIPIEFDGFLTDEINNIQVIRVDKNDPSLMDILEIKNILWSGEASSNNEAITDYAPESIQESFGPYDSYFDNCHLIFKWHTGSDTFANIQIKKSKEKITGCHKDDPNIKIDLLSFTHKGKKISKNETVTITK